MVLGTQFNQATHRLLCEGEVPISQVYKSGGVQHFRLFRCSFQRRSCQQECTFSVFPSECNQRLDRSQDRVIGFDAGSHHGTSLGLIQITTAQRQLGLDQVSPKLVGVQFQGLVQSSKRLPDIPDAEQQARTHKVQLSAVRSGRHGPVDTFYRSFVITS